MEIKMKMKNVEYIFNLKRNSYGTLVLQCNGWNLIEITEKGIERCRSVRLNAPFIDKEKGIIKWRTNHEKMNQYKSIGKRDIQLRITPIGQELYINAVIENDNDIHIGYIDAEGLYLWIDDRHELNSYAMSKDRTILVII